MAWLRILLFSLLIVTPATAQAADGQGRFALKGAGFLTCGMYLNERAAKSNLYYMVGGWIEGYVSAHNRYTDNTFDVTAFESLELLMRVMEGHCKDHPDDRLYPVVSSMLDTLAGDRLTESTPRVKIDDGTRKALLYRETIRRMQVRLADLGLYKGQADGTFTDATRSAVAAYQADQAFKQTGFPDQATLWRLFRM